MPAVQDRAQQFDFYKYLRIFWRRKWMLIVPLGICLPFCLWLAAIYPTEFRSRAILEMQHTAPKVEVRQQRLSVARELSTVHQRMFSWSAVRDIILSRKVDFGRDIDPDDRRQLERIYNEIMRRTRIGALGNRHLEISHLGRDSAQNAALVNELVKKYVGEDRRKAQEEAERDVEYYREKLDAVKAQLTEIDNQLRDFAQNNPWLHDDISSLHRELKDAEEAEELLQLEIAEYEHRLDELNKALAKEEPELTIVRQIDPPAEVVEAQKSFEAMQQYFNEVSANFTPAHRRYQDAKRRLEAAAVRLKEVGEPDLTEEQTVDNPKYAELQQQVGAAGKALEKLNRRKLDANKKVSELYLLRRKAPELMTERTRLNEMRNAAQNLVNELGRHHRAADKELQRLMTEAYSTKFKVLEYARPSTTPVKSTKLKIVALGVMVGMLTGVGLIVLVEYLDQTFKTIDDAREVLGIPALGVIPAIYTPRDHRRRLWFRVLAVSSAVFVVGVGVTLYLAVPAVKEMIVGQIWPRFQEIVQSF